jgi:hypothetical protein
MTYIILIYLILLFYNNNINKVSSIVTNTPAQIGIPNKIFKAIADPKTSYCLYNYFLNITIKFYLHIRTYNSYFCH